MPADPTQNEAEFDEFAVDYDAELNKGLALSGESKDYFASGRMEWLRRKFERRGFAPKVALDFGCGTGSSTPYFFDTLGVDSLSGVDPSDDSLGVARVEFGDRQVEFSTSENFHATGPIDFAFCNGVFHHIPIAHREAAVSFVFENLRPGGLFAFWENNAWNPVTRYAMSKVAFDRDAILLFPHGARTLLKNGGFEIVATDYQFFFPSPLALFRPMEKWLSKLPLGGQYLVLARKPG
ncbi:MAG: SAM-dependent methyltransferase [Verrucomicrobiales bacterium]|jgi:SAM-dependent methyltransferase